MPTADTVPAPPGRLYWLLWTAVAVACCLPVWLVHVPPLSDYLNHLARLHILAEYDAVAEYRAFYVVDWGDLPYPNLALEAIGLVLLRVTSLAVVAKVFVTSTILVWQLGVTLLGRAVYGRLTWRALIVGFFVLNQQFLHGYMNFAFAMGVAMIALAVWLGGRQRWRAWRLLVVTVLAGAAYCAHLFGFATLAIAVAVMTVSRLIRILRRDPVDPGASGVRDDRDPSTQRPPVQGIAHLGNAIAGVLPLVPFTVVFVVSVLGRADAGVGVSWAPLTYNARDSLTLLTGYDPIVDAASLVVVALLVVVGFVRRTGIAVKADVLAAGLVLGVLYWVFPADLATGQDVNVRFALGAFTLLAFAVDVTLPERVRSAVLLIALGLFSARVGTTAAYFIELDDAFAAQRAAFEAIEPGSALHTIYFYPAPRVLNARRVHGLALIHASAYAAVTRRANVPTLYAIPGWQPLAHREPLYRAHRFQDGSRPDIPWDEVFSVYDYVWACRAPDQVIAPLLERAVVAAKTRDCVLYRLPRQPDGDLPDE